jgi:hypothetical protein
VLTLPKKDQIREDKVKQARHTRPPQSVIARSPMSLLSDGPRSDNKRARRKDDVVKGFASMIPRPFTTNEKDHRLGDKYL